jgi:hypothetical protein
MTDLEKAMKEANDLADKLLADSMSKKNAAVKWLNKGIFTVHVDNKMAIAFFVLAMALFML